MTFFINVSNVGLELHNGLLPTLWDAILSMIRRHAITILIFHGGDGSPVSVPPRDIIWMGTWRTLHPQRILHVPGAIIVHVDFSLDESRTRALRSGVENATD